MNFLAGIFEKLANDPSWPWTLEPTVMGRDLHRTIIKYGEEQGEWFQVNHVDFAAWVAQSPLTVARLALMVVESKQGASDYALEGSLSFVLEINDINPDHYANVKKRVADMEIK